MSFQENSIVGNHGYPINFIPRTATSVTPHDTDTFAEGLLFVGVSGNVTCRPAGQASYVVFKNVPAGTFLPIYIIGVHTDTTATDMLISY